MVVAAQSSVSCADGVRRRAGHSYGVVIHASLCHWWRELGISIKPEDAGVDGPKSLLLLVATGEHGAAVGVLLTFK